MLHKLYDPNNHIEIISIEYLDNRELSGLFQEISNDLKIELGWHYLLDLSWAAQQLNQTTGMRILDAGAGFGVMQWWLAEHGADVISVDRSNRRNFSMRLRQRYRIQNFPKQDFSSKTNYDFLPSLSSLLWYLNPKNLITSFRQMQVNHEVSKDSGTVYIYNHDLKNMDDIPDESVDAIVSISALEHNPPEELKECMDELMRVLKPGGKLVATMAAAKEKDWYHEPSKGWCFTEATLRKVFDLSISGPTNYEKYDELFESLKNCRELRDNLSPSYFKSGDNGMPWGIWNPLYQPVGVCKVKKISKNKI